MFCLDKRRLEEFMEIAEIALGGAHSIMTPYYKDYPLLSKDFESLLRKTVKLRETVDQVEETEPKPKTH